jgi:hypothetical protein
LFFLAIFNQHWDNNMDEDLANPPQSNQMRTLAPKHIVPILLGLASTKVENIILKIVLVLIVTKLRRPQS